MILQEAERGVNLLIWSFINLRVDPVSKKQDFGFSINTTCIAAVAQELTRRGLPTSHLISIGGWDAPHPDTSYTAKEWWAFFKDWNEGYVANPELGFDGFAGIDWDVEGVNNLTSAYNEISLECFQLMGEMSHLAKGDGYLVTVVPAQSYLNPSVPQVDLSLRHSSPCAADFHYAGSNGYTALLAKYGSDTFDLVSVQLYETWSYINCKIRSLGNPPKQLREFVRSYTTPFWMDFSNITKLGIDIPPEDWHVHISPSQLLVGFSFGAGGSGKSIYIAPTDLGEALHGDDLPKENWPRGAFFWNLDLDGNRPVNGTAFNTSFASGFNDIFHTRV